jgi:type I restriction enzyme S subunit
VDFDPVRTKAEGGDPGLPDDVAALFPDSFEDSELGKIPTGWKAKPIGQAVKCVGGSTPSTKNPAFWDGGKNPFVTPKDMSSLTSPVILDTSRHITDAGVDKISSGRLPIGTVILSSRAPIGYLAITEVPVSVNQGVIAMICNKDLPNHYVLHWTETNMETIKSNAGGTTFAEISKRNFRPIPVVVPQNLVLEAFVQQVEPLHKQVVLNLQESNSLASLRDTLLPKLISGELRVPDAEKFFEEAGL